MAAENRIGVMCLLSSAACEWFLIVLLFVHASLSHVLSRFAEYCRLEIPCILCSRLDEKNPGCYWNLLCDGHRQEISCLVSCSIHAKFADVHSMCDECLSPIVNHNKSTSDSYRLLVGKSWLDVDRSVLQNLVLNKHVRLGSPDHTCSCCGKTWSAKSGTERLIELNPPEANVKPPLPRPLGRSHFSRRDSLKRLRDKFTRKLTNQPPVDVLSHVGYTELKISSDSESEFPFSDDDNNNDNRGNNNKQSLPDVTTELGEGGNVMKNTLSVDVGFDASEYSCERTSPCLVSTSGDGFDTDGDSNVLLPRMQALSVLSEFLSLCNVPPSPDAGTDQMPMKIDIAGTSENEGDSPVGEASSDDEHSLQTTNTHELSHMTSASDSINNEPGPPSKEIVPDKPNTYEDESLQDWHTLSDTECDNIVERLIREAEHDKNLLTNLCRELEEERSASAIATNQAMSMITRLQEEKAALHMEALQYLRMMEEQAEYDMEALGRANDILAEKEKEVQDLEIELEFYRNNFLDESSVHNLQSENGVCEPKNISSSTSFVNEKAYITQCLEKLERNIIGRPDGLFTKNVVPLSNNDDCLMMPVDGFAKEIARLQDRLEAVEADRDFVKHTCDVLRSGKVGLELVQEIAQQLHELRRMEFGRR